MKIHFKIAFNTVWGQQLIVKGNIPQLGNSNYKKGLPLHYQTDGNWVGSIDIDPSKVDQFTYKYLLYNENSNQHFEEWGDDRLCHVSLHTVDNLFCNDSWNSPGALENTLLTAPFANVLLQDEHEISDSHYPTSATHIFKIKAPVIPKNSVVCIIGNASELGKWSVTKPTLLRKTSSGYWETAIHFKSETTDIQYKYGLFDVEDKRFTEFEQGQDRFVSNYKSKKTLIIQEDGFLRTSIPAWRGAGVGIPVFSLRTKKSFGVGDFNDMKLLVDWSKKVGIKLIQVLPLNDTIGTHSDLDVLPYAAISAFALNPLFLHLPTIGKLPAQHALSQRYKKLQPTYNAQTLVPFMDVINFKLEYAREVYLANKSKIGNDNKFMEFVESQAHWLKPYAAFCVLRDRYNTSDYQQWESFSKFDSQLIETFVSPDQEQYDQVAVNYFMQYQLHLQLLETVQYAHKQGIVLKGDIPIGVNRNSADTWMAPELFNMNSLAGAPPDMFAVKGQNWELPTYNWDAIKRTNFDWWHKRFEQMSLYFDTFRIDHILGFFRIWQIPQQHIEGIMGHLHPSNPVHINEFSEQGIWFDYNRFCKPHITDAVLWENFGEESGWVRTNCLQIEDGWVLRLKPAYSTQEAVEKLYKEDKISEKVKWGLFDLISNVLFFEQEGSQGSAYYPRFGFHTLSTYRDLDDYSKSKLNDIYINYFYRRQDAFWYTSGMEKLPALKRATNMLICGEDLGFMTPCVTQAMKELSILSLEVQRVPKLDSIEFFHPANAPYLSVVTPSTHDMSTVRGWWEEDRAVTQRFYNTQLGHWGEAPFFCEWWICRDILLQHLHSPAMWAVFQMQDLLGTSEAIRHENPHEERINVPSNSMHSWRYRMHITLEELIENDTFNDELKNFITQSGR